MGRQRAAKWLIEQLGGKGKILVLNGPAGVSVSDDRRKGAEPVLEANPDIKILAETNTAYNVAPAQEAVTSLLFANPEIDGILSLGGALSAGAILAMDKQGRDAGADHRRERRASSSNCGRKRASSAGRRMQPNWLGAFAAYAAVQALEGKDVPAFVKVPLPIIDDTQHRRVSRPGRRTSRPTATSTRPTTRSCSTS